MERSTRTAGWATKVLADKDDKVRVTVVDFQG